MSIHRGFVHCRLEYIQVGTPSELLWAQFPDSLSEISEARAYVMLYESPVDGLDLSLEETVALRSSSLLVTPPPPPGHSPLSGHRGQILAEASLPKWASLVQEVASGMRQPPLEAQTCPPDYYDSLLSRLSTLARIPYCCQCYKLGPVCTCPKGQPANSRWTRPVQPYTGTTSTAPVSMSWLYPYLGVYLSCRRTLGGVTPTRVSPTSSDSFYGCLVTLDQYPGYRREPAEDCWCRQGAQASKCASTTGTTCTRSNRDPASSTSVRRTSCLHLCRRW